MAERKLDGRTTGYAAGDAKPGGRGGRARPRGDLPSPKEVRIVDRKPGKGATWRPREGLVLAGGQTGRRGSATKGNPSVKRSGFTRKPKKR